MGCCGLGGAFWEAVDLIEMNRERKGLLFASVNEKLSSDPCVRGQTAEIMWERGYSQKGCLSGDICCWDRRG